MATVLKCIFGLFILTGIAISLYGCWEVLGTMTFVRNAAERTKGIFTGYHEEEVVSRSSSTNQFGQLDFQDTTSYMSYSQFEFTGKNGQKQHITEAKNHIIGHFKPGQEVEIIVSPYGDHRIAGFYSLYVRDLSILIFGLCFIFIPLLIGKVVIPSLETPAGMDLANRAGQEYARIFSSKIGLGPITVGALLKGVGIFIAAVLIIALGSALTPYVKQMHLGFGWGLMEALREQRFDEARQLILKGKGINKVNEYNQNPLLLAMEAGQFDLARLLIEAGADVNIKSKMYKTPLLVAAQSGDLATVKLLLSKGASPDAPEDELPPIFHALAKKHYEVARALIESKCDLKRVYVEGDNRFTVGDLTVMARRPELTELVQQRGGSFTITP